MNPNAKPANHIAAIHALKHKLRLSDDDYRALLMGLTGQASSKACTQDQRAAVRQHMQRLAERMGVASPSKRADQQPRYVQSARPLERKVWALWHAIGREGRLESPTPAALQAFVKRQTGMDHLRFCDDWQLHGLVESLKYWQGRPLTAPRPGLAARGSA
jgi:phage gp16-like protein